MERSNNSQAGPPYRCTLIHPSTNKPCDTIFSRPYDLDRHKDTIHNDRKPIVKCPICREERTFSRNDALVRHMRTVHPDELIQPERSPQSCKDSRSTAIDSESVADSRTTLQPKPLTQQSVLLDVVPRQQSQRQDYQRQDYQRQDYQEKGLPASIKYIGRGS